MQWQWFLATLPHIVGVRELFGFGAGFCLGPKLLLLASGSIHETGSTLNQRSVWVPTGNDEPYKVLLNGFPAPQ